MSDAHYQVYTEMEAFLEFSDEDTANLIALRPIFEKHGPGITNAFYDSLQNYPKTAAIVEGRVESLKKTHIKWIGTLFSGEYGRPFFDQQYRIGEVHVTQNILPEYVEAVTSLLRSHGRIAVFEELGSGEDAQAKYASLAKILDLCLLTINLAYADERIARISKVTGMSRKLIENLVRRGAKK